MITKQATANHEEWKALRHQYIGGSDAAAVVGMNAFVSPYALWAEKTGRLPGFEGNLATEVGTYLEEFVAQKFATETGKRFARANRVGSMTNTLGQSQTLTGRSWVRMQVSKSRPPPR